MHFHNNINIIVPFNEQCNFIITALIRDKVYNKIFTFSKLPLNFQYCYINCMQKYIILIIFIKNNFKSIVCIVCYV